jgi:hypothetical protein
MWTCIICSVTMAVNNGLSHITSEDHMACMLQYNARALAYRLEELSSTLAEESKSTLAELVGFPGVRNVFAEKGTPGGTLSYINFFSIQTDIKPPQSTPRLLNAVGVSSPAVALWTCELCNRIMQENSKLDHLVGKAHAKKLMSESLTSKTPVMPANKASRRTNTKLDSFVEPPLRNWTCPACNFVFAIQEKTHHRCSSSESKPSTIDGPLDKFFRSYPSFRYDPSKPPAISFARLQNHLQQRHGWAHRGPETDELWHRYQAVLTQEFNLWFGVEDDLDAWHSLCRALRITSLPTTCELCRLVGPQTSLPSTCTNAQLRPFAAAMSISSILLNGAAAVANTSRYFPPSRD